MIANITSDGNMCKNLLNMRGFRFDSHLLSPTKNNNDLNTQYFWKRAQCALLFLPLLYCKKEFYYELTS